MVNLRDRLDTAVKSGIGVSLSWKECKGLMTIQAENKQFRKFAEKWKGHESGCDYLDEGSPRDECTCGYEAARILILME